jgi:hypothetical protein
MFLLDLTCMARFAKVEQWLRHKYLDATIRRIFLSPQPCEMEVSEVGEVQEVNKGPDLYVSEVNQCQIKRMCPANH